MAIYPNNKVHQKEDTIMKGYRLNMYTISNFKDYCFYYEYLNAFRHSPVALLVTHPLEI